MASSIKALFIFALFTTWQCSSGTSDQAINGCLTSHNHRCKFPFRLNNATAKLHFKCIEDRRGRKWCPTALKDDFTLDDRKGRMKLCSQDCFQTNEEANEDQISRIQLPIHSCMECGGYQLSIRLKTGSAFCTTREVSEFSNGQQLTWSGRQLGSCRGFPVDNRSKVKLRTTYNNQYAVQGTMTIHTSSSKRYQANIPIDWRSQEDNKTPYAVASERDEVVRPPELCPTDEETSCHEDDLRTYEVTQERFQLTCGPNYRDGCHLVSKTFDPNHPDEDYYRNSGFRCVPSVFFGRQFRYCCLTHRVENANGDTMIPHCDTVTQDQPEQGTDEHPSNTPDYFQGYTEGESWR